MPSEVTFVQCAAEPSRATIRTTSMTDTIDTLTLDLLEWIGPGRRPYAETLDAWRTSCPRLPVWEHATDSGFIARHHEIGHPAHVSVSAAGVEHLRRHRPESRS
jgi:hypothetical protein